MALHPRRTLLCRHIYVSSWQGGPQVFRNSPERWIESNANVTECGDFCRQQRNQKVPTPHIVELPNLILKIRNRRCCWQEPIVQPAGNEEKRFV